MNRNPAVDKWFASYESPMKTLVRAVRETILAADERIEETIKWQAPTFVYRGNLASFFPKAKKHASLMFHKGKFIQGDFPSLEGDGKEARTMKFSSLEDLESKKAELTSLVIAWCDQQESRK
jgi:uncharacterized protein YdhG (YjbR/CyaY superfamily)